MQALLFRHAALHSSIVPLPVRGTPSLVKPHASTLLTLERKHDAPALIMFPLLHIQIGTLKGGYATKRADQKACVNVDKKKKKATTKLENK